MSRTLQAVACGSKRKHALTRDLAYNPVGEAQIKQELQLGYPLWGKAAWDAQRRGREPGRCLATKCDGEFRLLLPRQGRAGQKSWPVEPVLAPQRDRFMNSGRGTTSDYSPQALVALRALGSGTPEQAGSPARGPV